jgi:hypothetical protein
MATVTFTALKCERKHDVTGSDEPEIWIGSRMIWNGVMKKGDTEQFVLEENFDNSIKVAMKERNGDRDDHKFLDLGTVTITTNSRGPIATYKTTGAHYELSYFVRP